MSRRTDSACRSEVGDRPAILFATISIGGGHVATARAMAEAVERHYPGCYELAVSDYMKDLGVTGLDRLHKGFWRRALRLPVVARAGQRVIDSVPRVTITGQRRILRGFARAAAEHLMPSPPRLIVSNHGLITSGLAEAKRLYGLDVPVLTFATEPHGISAYWADPRADHIVAPSEEVRRDLVRFGVPAEKTAVVGYPVGQAFLDAPTKAEARARLALPDRFTCLVSFGGEGVAESDPRAVIRALLDAEPAPQVVMITGRNQALRKRLSPLESREDRLRIEGFTDEVACYLAASDVFIGKAGPASVYEALAVGRPALLTGYTALNERGVVRFVEEEGLGHFTRTPEELQKVVWRYASEPALLEEVVHRRERLGLPSMTEQLAHHIVRYATG
ncbi:MAG: glycosyltransferase [Rubrobacteraceae bacterium]